VDLHGEEFTSLDLGGCDGDGNPKWEGKGEAVRERERKGRHKP